MTHVSSTPNTPPRGAVIRSFCGAAAVLFGRKCCLWLLIAVGAGSVIDLGFGSVSALALGPEHDPVAGIDDRQRRLAALQTELFDLDRAALEAAATSYRGEDPSIWIDAMLLRAGRPIPPGVSAARRAQRTERAAEAIEWLRREMATKGGRISVESSLRVALDFGVSEKRPASRPLTKAAIGVVVQLELREWAPMMARGLSSKRSPGPDDGVRRCVQGALFQLFGRWFESPESFDAEWPDLDGVSAASLGLDVLRIAHERADRNAATLMEFAPTEVGADPLGLFDPKAAAEMARAAGRALAAGRLSPEEVIGLLGKGVESEARPVPLHARVETMLDLIQGVDPAGPAAAGVRSAVLLIGSDPSITADRAWIFLGALRRLYYPLGPSGDALRAETLAAGTAVLKTVLSDRREQPLDPDGLTGAISALADLARSVTELEVRTRAARSLVLELYGLVGRDSSESIGVQRAAAKALRLSIEPADARELLRLLGGMGTSEVEYELLGTLRAAISVLEPGSDVAEAVLAELFLAIASPEFDARARALGVLLAEDVRPALAAKARDVRSRWLMQRVESEPSPELRRDLLGLMGRLGDLGVLEQLTERPGLMALVVSDGAESVGALGGCLRTLGEGGDRARLSGQGAASAGYLKRAARALAEVRLPRGPARALPSRAFVLRESLRLMLAEGAAGQPAPWDLADHRWTVRATLELLRVGPPLGVRVLTQSEFDVILDAHVAPLVAGSAEPSDRESFEIHALRALIRARAASEFAAEGPEISGTADVADGTFEATLADFDQAIELCPDGRAGVDAPKEQAGYASQWTRRALELERIEFLRVNARFESALLSFDALWDASDPASDPSIAEARAYLELMAAAPPAAHSPPRLSHAIFLLSLIVDRAEVQAPQPSAVPSPDSASLRDSLRWLAEALGPNVETPAPFRAALFSSGGAPLLKRLDALLEDDDSSDD